VNLTLSVVDAFTDQPFTGNPAAVAVVDRFPDDRYMQAVAREMNLSETAFVVARPDGNHDLRWFTRSPARPTALWRYFGASGSEKVALLVNRRRREAGGHAWSAAATGSNSEVRP